MTHRLTYAAALRDAMALAMKLDESVICYGLGVDDPKGVFGTTLGLREEFGEARVFDVPTSENALMGVAVGAALNGIRPVVVHQRFDFFLLAMDQLVNNAAKWHYMFGGQACVPLTVRLVVGQGWGQGPTHSQCLHAWLTHVPGLKVVMPATASDARGLLLASIFDDNPVVFIEHRWLYELTGDVPDGDERVEIGKACCLQEGSDVTIVSLSYITVEALHAVKFLRQFGISCELIDLRSVRPVDWDTVFGSVRKTGRLLALDTSWETGCFAGEVVARVSMACHDDLRQAPCRLALPDFPVPAGPSLTEQFYPRAEDIVATVGGMVGKDIDTRPLADRRSWPSDVPGDWFRGPF